MSEASVPLVGVIMGSDSDWPTMRAATEALAEFGVAHEVRVVSAHRTPHAMLDKHAGIGQKEQLVTANDNAKLEHRVRSGYLKQSNQQEHTACQRMYWPSRRKSSAPM